jgi:NAD(P)-dependent dehydrogenase (short-subunit alcohol dehydrogenase family)
VNKSIFITGCSTGIGLDVALGLKARGYQVFASARKPSDVLRLKELALQACQLDLDDSESIHRGVEWLLEQTNNTLYALFNNGAYGQQKILGYINL